MCRAIAFKFGESVCSGSEQRYLLYVVVPLVLIEINAIALLRCVVDVSGKAWYGIRVIVQEVIMPRLTVDLPSDQYEALENYATAHQISLAEAVRRALDQFVATERSRTEDLDTTRMVVTDQHVIGPDEYMNMDIGL
jgi:hypothetical protein